MKNNTKTRIISSLAALIVMLSLTSGCSKINESEKESEESDTTNIEIVQTTNEPVIYELHYETDTVDVDSEIDKLGIVDDESYPRNVYKVIRYIDNDHYERIGIVKAYVQYKVDEEKNVVSEYYDVYNIFNNEYLFTCDNFDNVSNDEVFYLTSFDKLDSIRYVVVSKGMNEEYVDSVLATIKGKNNLSLREVAYVYVMLVNSNNRLQSNEMQLKMSNN
jgi:hypothetical protein